MSSSPVIDVHTHVPCRRHDPPAAEGGPVHRLKLQRVDTETAVLEVAGVAYKPFPRGSFDNDRRLQDTDWQPRS